MPGELAVYRFALGLRFAVVVLSRVNYGGKDNDNTSHVELSFYMLGAVLLQFQSLLPGVQGNYLILTKFHQESSTIFRDFDRKLEMECIK